MGVNAESTAGLPAAGQLSNTFGKYRIESKIAEGGFGAVYAAYDPWIKRPVAIKICHASDPDTRRRFQHEAEIAGNLDHPNIVRVFDFGVHEGVPFLVQEYLVGQDLDRLVADHELVSLPEKLLILIQVARGLRYAHARGVVHRDVKPANIRVLEDGTAKLMDFGIATLASEERRQAGVGMTEGTAAYLAPEQIRGEEATERTDVFAYGAVAYETLSGRSAFQGDTVSALLFQISHQDPIPLSSHASAVPEPLERIVTRCLIKDPTARWQGFGDIVDALESFRDRLRKRDLSRRRPLVPKPKRGPAPVLAQMPLHDNHTTVATTYAVMSKPRRKYRAPILATLVGALLLAGAYLYSDPTQLERLALSFLGTPEPAVSEESIPAGALTAAPDTEFVSDAPPSDDFEEETTTNAENVARAPEEVVAVDSAEPLPEVGKTLDVAEEAAPPPPPQPATVRLRAAWDPRITVSVDRAKPWPLTRNRVLQLDAGEHTLTYSLVSPGYIANKTVNLRLDFGEQRTLANPIKPPGALTVQAELGSPQGIVIVDGRTVGVSPIRRRLLPPGEHWITIRNRNPESAQNVNIAHRLSSRQESILTFDLRRADEITISEAPLQQAQTIPFN